MDKAKEFIITLSSALSGLTPEVYAEKMSDDASDTHISEIETLVNKICKVKMTPELYVDYIRPLKSQLVGLECFLFNMKFPEEKQERVSKILSKLQNFSMKWARKQSRGNVNKESRPIVKYAINALGRHYYRNYDVEKAAKYLIDEGLVFYNDKKDCYAVIGLHLAVGDNVFTVGRNGNQWRNYIGFTAPEAFFVRDEFKAYFKELDKGQIPILPPYFEMMSIGDHKGCCKISLSYEEQNRIREFGSSY